SSSVGADLRVGPPERRGPQKRGPPPGLPPPRLRAIFSKAKKLFPPQLFRYRLFDKLPPVISIPRACERRIIRRSIVGATLATASDTYLSARVNRMEPQGLRLQPHTPNLKSSSGRSRLRRVRTVVVSSVALAVIALLALFWLFRPHPPKPF